MMLPAAIVVIVVTAERQGFVPPPYPYDRLGPLRDLADEHPGGCVDLSVGTPNDPPPAAVLEALASSGTERGYPPSVGTPSLRGAIVSWLTGRFGVEIAPSAVAVCVGTKELVAGVPHWLRLRDPGRDTVLYPAISYPTYAMGATLAGARAVPVRTDARGRLDLASVDADDAGRALCLWVNSPSNPTGALDDLGEAARWGRQHGVPVLSDECYADFTWDGSARSILEHGSEGVLAVHSLSKRSNLAGVRVGFYAGDPQLVEYLSEVRKHSGFMVPGPVQAAAVAAYGDERHVDAQRGRYLSRLQEMSAILGDFGLAAPMPAGGFYLWVEAPSGDSWELAETLARRLGILVSPGEFYGDDGNGHVRLAMVQPDDRIALVAERLGTA